MVQAFTRLAQKGVEMEIEIVPSRITFDHHGQSLPFRFKLKIIRGPFVFESKIYKVEDKNQLYLDFEDEQFKKESTFYFTDKGAEFKKAIIKVIKLSANDKESDMVSEQINLSTIISMKLRDEIIEISRNGVEKLEIQCCCRPIGDQKDIEFVSGFIALDVEKDPNEPTNLQTPKGSSGKKGLFGAMKSENTDQDPLVLARETKELEARIKEKDAHIKELLEEITKAEQENEQLTQEKEDQDKILEGFTQIKAEQSLLEEQSDVMNKTAVTYRDYSVTTDFDGKYGII